MHLRKLKGAMRVLDGFCLFLLLLLVLNHYTGERHLCLKKSSLYSLQLTFKRWFYQFHL